LNVGLAALQKLQDWFGLFIGQMARESITFLEVYILHDKKTMVPFITCGCP
jgi:hypothetical protein